MRSTIGVEHSGRHCSSCKSWVPQGLEACARCGAPITAPSAFVPDLSVAVTKALRGRYEIIAEIGRGAHAIVYQAIQVSLERKVALKVLRQHLAGNERFVRRFHHEARAIAQLRHPNVVTIYDEGTAEGIHYMAMEFLEGENLHRVISRRGRLSPDETVHVAAQIARALDYAHARGLIHRDVKSGNILLSAEWRAVLMDFGIAHPKSMPHSGSIIGTPEFMSPEQAAGRTVDARTDFYGLGAVMYHALCGRTPYESGDGLTTLRRIAEEQYRPLGEIAAVPRWLESAVDRCLAKDRERRIGRAEELLAIFAANGRAMAGLTALSPAVPAPATGEPTGEGADTQVEDAPPRRRGLVRPLLTVLITGSLLAVLASTTLFRPEENAAAVLPPATPSALPLPDSILVPRLIGLSPEEARDAIAAAGLEVGPTLRALGGAGYAGKVFKQIPAPGLTVARGRKVILHVGLAE